MKWALGRPKKMVYGVRLVITYALIGGLEHEWIMNFHEELGMPS